MGVKIIAKYLSAIWHTINRIKNQIIMFVVICFFATILSIQYFNSLSDILNKESEQYLGEISKRISTNINQTIEYNYSILYTASKNLKFEGITINSFFDMLKNQQEQWGYEKIIIIDNKGVATTISGRNVSMQLDTNTLNEMTKGSGQTLTAQTIDNAEYLLFSIPIDNVEIGGRVITSIAAGFSPSAFDDELVINAFDEEFYSQIITTSGMAVTKNNNRSLKIGYNVFSSIEQQISGAKTEYNRFKNSIINSKMGLISLKFLDEERSIVFTPIDAGNWMVVTYIPKSVMNEQLDIVLSMTVLLLGTITILIAALLTGIIYNNYNNRKNLEKIAYHDDVTGGNTIKKFHLIARKIFNMYPNKNYAIVFTNIEKFKILNEQLGQEECNRLLRNVYRSINNELDKDECMARISADNFCVLIKYGTKEDIIDRLKKWPYEESMKEEGHVSIIMPKIELGIYEIVDKSLDIANMIDRGKLALEKSGTPGTVSGKVHYYHFDNKIREELYREKEIEDQMQDALDNHEFVVYIQPKYKLSTNKIDGGEALVRWFGEKGMISPGEFIPLFEKNGFVVKLDLYVLEEVCKTMKRWNQSGYQPMKISINCSRIHFYNDNFIDDYIAIIRKYDVDPKYIEIEITESAIYDYQDRLREIISLMRKAGFGCSMDDFGSGYSSLNILQQIPVDTIKIDRIFFTVSSDEIKREAILGSIISMAKTLGMTTVAEGIEEERHVEMLRRLECDYVQGYIFDKPLTITDFENKAFVKGR